MIRISDAFGLLLNKDCIRVEVSYEILKLVLMTFHLITLHMGQVWKMPKVLLTVTLNDPQWFSEFCRTRLDSQRLQHMDYCISSNHLID